MRGKRSPKSARWASPSLRRSLVRQAPKNFGPDWLAARIAALMPAYPDVSLCVALSGGVDSTALLAALAAIRPKPARLRALHVDHGLRPASKEWAQHCRSLARRLHVPLKVLTTKVERMRGESLEAAAREARYRLLASALEPDEALVTAHHSDDQLETVLLQLFRGSGLPGLAGMPALASFAKGWLVRPLLSRSRAEIEVWALEHELTWVDDDSNADAQLDRNYLRLHVLPLVRARWPGSPAAVARSARHAAEAQALLDTLALADVDRARYGESLSVRTLRALPADRRRNALRFWITRAGYLAPDTRRLEEIAGGLMEARSDANPSVEWSSTSEGAPLDAPKRVRLRRDGDLLTLTRAAAVTASTSADIRWSWRECRTCTLPGDLGKLELEPDERGPIDLDALPDVLTVRWRGGGERLAPHKGRPSRSLKNLLQEARVPVAERGRLPLLFSSTPDGAQLVAVADLLIDASVQAMPGTRKRGRLSWSRS